MFGFSVDLCGINEHVYSPRQQSRQTERQTNTYRYINSTSMYEIIGTFWPHYICGIIMLSAMLPSWRYHYSMLQKQYTVITYAFKLFCVDVQRLKCCIMLLNLT